MDPSAAPFLPSREGNSGALITTDGYLNPTGAAFANLAWNLDALKFDHRLEIAPGVVAFVFKSKTTETAVIATKPGATTGYKVPGGYFAKSVDLFGNPVPKGTALGPQIIYATASTQLVDMDQLLTGRWPFSRHLWILLFLAPLFSFLILGAWRSRRSDNKLTKAP